MSFKICLIGSIPKGDDHRKDWTDWKTRFTQVLSRLDDVEFVDGDDWKDESRPQLTFGHDASMIKSSDLIIVDAEKEIGKGIGAGTAQEILIAKYFLRPVIAVIPKNTHHRRSNIIFNGNRIEDWIHPFLLCTSDLVVERIEDTLAWIDEYQQNPKGKCIKDMTVIDEAIVAYQHYHNTNG